MWIKWNSFALLEGSKMIHPLRSHIRFPSKWEKITTWYNKTSEDILKERKEGKKAVFLRYLHAHFHSMFFNITKMWRQPMCFLGGWRDKQKVVYTCDGLLFSPENDRNAVTCCNMGKPWGFYVKWNDQTQKDKYCMLYLSGPSKEVTCVETEGRMVTASGEGKGETGSYYLGGWSSRFARWWSSGDLIHSEVSMLTLLNYTQN